MSRAHSRRTRGRGGAFAPRCCRTCTRSRARAGPAAGARHRARRRRSRVGDLRPQQGQGGRRVRTPGRPAAPAGDRDARRAPRRSSRAERSAEHDGILVQSPLPAGDGPRRRAAGLRRDRSGQGRRRLHTRQRRPARAGPRASGAVHAVGRHRDARCAAASPIAGARAVVLGRSDIVGKPMALLLLQPRRDGDDLPLEDAGPRRRVAATADILVAAIGRPGFVTRGVRQAGRDGDRRRHQPGHRSRDGRARFLAPDSPRLAGLRAARIARGRATCIPA